MYSRVRLKFHSSRDQVRRTCRSLIGDREFLETPPPSLRKILGVGAFRSSGNPTRRSIDRRAFDRPRRTTNEKSLSALYVMMDTSYGSGLVGINLPLLSRVREFARAGRETETRVYRPRTVTRGRGGGRSREVGGTIT